MNERRDRITHVFAGNPVDRGEVERRDEEWLTAQASDPASRMLPMWKLNVPVSAEQELSWLNIDDLRRLNVEAEPIFLGLIDGVSHFVVDVSAVEREEIEKDGLTFEDARTTAEYLSSPDSGIVAQARSQLSWHGSHGFCAVCGRPTHIARGGQVRRCAPKRTGVAAGSITHEPIRWSLPWCMTATVVCWDNRGGGWWRCVGIRRWPGLWIRESPSRKRWPGRLWRRLAYR